MSKQYLPRYSNGATEKSHKPLFVIAYLSHVQRKQKGRDVEEKSASYFHNIASQEIVIVC
jgi:hypothetical protein